MRLPLVLPFFNPVVRPAFRIVARGHRRNVVALRLDRHAIALRLALRHVDVQKRSRGKRPPEHRVGHDRCGPRGERKVVLAPRGPERHRNARNPEERAFERPGNGSRIGHIVSEVPALVDARHHQVGKRVKHLAHGNVHAIGRGAVDGARMRVDAFQAERMAQCQRVTDGACFFDRCDDGDVPARTERLGERADAVGTVPIIVGHENPRHEGHQL